MKINTNISSMSALRSLGNTSKALGRALERLASGKRINSARDDAAGLAIGTGLESQRRGMLQAVRNVNDAQGFLGTAEGAIAEQTNLVQRMRELALQSANGTLGANDRSYLNSELQQLFLEYQRITDQTNFNGTNLIDGTFSTSILQVGTRKEETIGFNLDSTQSSNVFTKLAGTGSFTSAVTYSASATLTRGLAVGDFNGDGAKDFVNLVAADNTSAVYINDGTGAFNVSKKFGGYSGITDAATGDFNGDGNVDFVTSCAIAGVSSFVTYLGNGDGTFKTPITSTNGSSARMAVGDVNEDGILDICTPGASNSMSVFLGGGQGQFSLANTYATTGTQNIQVELVDLNNDRHLDQVTYNANGYAYSRLGNGDGTFASSYSQTVTMTGGYDDGGSYYGRTADMNNDGILDMVAAGRVANVLRVYLGTGAGAFSSTALSSVTLSNARTVEVADINTDGFNDVIACDSAGTYSVAYNLGNGSLSTPTTISSSGAYPVRIIAEDFDGDQIADILSNDYVNGRTYLRKALTATVSISNSDFSIATQSKAQKLLSSLDAALSNLNTRRSAIGAMGARLNSAINVSAITVENLSAARSQIMDSDVAAETAELTRNQILQQAGVSVLGQANVQMQTVLSLLGGLR